ncbi:unnamed protein product [Lactuca saligna]|uniref:DUF7036 domain-containing protein n=1 Tax=Lactuca saligna TaxID=75948 RepID=A0AA36EF91_LACSI|nr:unnamed protein product [Lactuca saligna]
MGKSEPQLPIHNQQEQNHDGVFSFVRCPMCFSRIARFCSFKCVFVLLLSVSVLLTAVFSIFHLHHRQSGFDAKASIKHSATVQAYFRLQKPISYLLPQIERLEYDINAEIGVPYTKVAILSMHKASASNWTHVVFGFVPDPINSPINLVSLSVLRPLLLDLFNRRLNLTLTTSIFGDPSSFDLVKFPGGITIIPKQSPTIWMLRQALFNFTLPNSVREIEENFGELKEQLKLGLHLKPYESVYMQVTNKAGSTRDSPVTVQASIVSDLGNLVPLRLKQLAQTITKSPPATNLGLDHSVFGKVKEISLSSYLSHTLNAPAPTPTPTPAPSPDLNDYAGPTMSPSPQNHAPVPNSPAPSVHRSCGGPKISPMYGPGPIASPPMSEKSEMPPGLSPLPVVSFGSTHGQQKGDEAGPPVSVAPTVSSLSNGSFNHITWCLLFFFTLVTLLHTL